MGKILRKDLRDSKVDSTEKKIKTTKRLKNFDKGLIE